MSVHLVDLCELIVDCEHKTAPTQEVGHPSIRTPNIGRGHLILENVNRVSEETYRLWTQRAVPRAGDLIMAREAPVGNVAIVPPGLNPCLGQRTLLIRPDQSKVDGGFLNYYLNGSYVQGLVHAKTNGATVPHLNMKDVRSLSIPDLPPLPIQRRIAGILSAYDDLIENSQRRIKILEEMARRLYRDWFVHFRFPGHESCRFVESPLGEIPEGWEVCLFTGIADVLSGGTPKTEVPDYWKGAIPFFTPRDVPDCFYVQDTDKHVTELGLSKCASELYPPDTVFITARGTVGKVALPSVPMAMNQSCYALRGKAGILQRFLFLMTLHQVDYLKKNTGGATFDTIVVDTFRRMQVVKPSRDIIATFAEIGDPIFEQVNTCQRQIINLRRTRDLLLPRLLSGQIDVEALSDPSATANVLPEAAVSLS
jgi:type I restriction enzyme S subunit